MIRATSVARNGRAAGSVTLAHAERLARRRALRTDAGERILLDLAETTELRHGDRLILEDGRRIEVIAAAEPLIEVAAGAAVGLARLAWHIGNRHAPCRIEASRLLIQDDPVMAEMLRRLGASVRSVSEPFDPEGGAYGHGRTMGHDHDHDHGPHGGS